MPTAQDPFSGAIKIPSNAPAATPASTPNNTFPDFIIFVFTDLNDKILKNPVAPDYLEQNGYYCYNQQNVNNGSCAVGKKSYCPKYYQNDCNDV